MRGLRPIHGQFCPKMIYTYSSADSHGFSSKFGVQFILYILKMYTKCGRKPQRFCRELLGLRPMFGQSCPKMCVFNFLGNVSCAQLQIWGEVKLKYTEILREIWKKTTKVLTRNAVFEPHFWTNLSKNVFFFYFSAESHGIIFNFEVHLC